MAVSRYYRADSVKSYLDSTVTDVGTQVTTTSNPNFPTSYPFTIIVNRDQANEEVMQVESLEGVVDGKYVWNVTRGTTVEPTMTKQTHNAGSTVEHGVSARDFRESREHEDGDDLVHGLGAGQGVVVGTAKSQTLTNKTFGSGTVMPMTYVTGLDDALAGKAPLNSPTFSGTVVLPSDTSIGSVSSTELAYVDGVTSAIQTQLNGKAATSHTHTVNVGSDSGRIVATTTAGALTTVTSTNQSGSTYLAGDLTWKTVSTSSGVSSIAGTANQITASASTGAVTLSLPTTLILPSNTTIGNVSSTELGYLDGVTSAIQTQLNNKLSSGYASVYASALSVTASGGITYANENFDSAGWHSVSSDTDRIKPLTSGKYLITATMSITCGGAAGEFIAYLRKNTTEVTGTRAAITLSTGGKGNLSFSTIISVNGSTDFADLYLSIPGNSGAPHSVTSTFNIQYVGA
jgi:hypothetical protein